MTEVVTSLLGPAMRDLGKTILVVVKRQFNYLCCFNSNIQNLRDEAQNLEDKRTGLQMQVEAAENNAEVIVPGVKTWLENAANKINITEIENEIPKARRVFLNLKSRYSTSRKAKKRTEAIKKLLGSCNFNPISQPAPPASMVSLPPEFIHEVPSRKEMEDDIVRALRCNNVHRLGICGMGGVGKTTMAKRIMNRGREQHLFDEVLMIVVSQQVDIFKMQREIGELLGIKWEVETIPGRAHQLRARLMGKNRILLVLDDLWESFKLDDLGIPRENERCTILLTSRNINVLNEMDTQKDCAVKILSEDEAWHLFCEKVGIFVDDSDLLSIAQQVVQECHGLPLALTTVGMTLKNNKNKRIWEHAVQQLRSSNPIDMPSVLEKVYNPIKLSYDFLVNTHARHIFLLCCLFPEDHDIHIDLLTAYGLGLRMFEEIDDLKQAGNKVCTLLDTLKNSFLLLAGCDENHVKMHDVVRDVAIFIASKEGLIHPNFSSKNCLSEKSVNRQWISVVEEEIIKLPIELSFPSLCLLFIHGPSIEFELPIDPSFLQQMKELNVLSFYNCHYASLPRTTQLPKKLRTLHLEGCYFLESISIVGELLSLEILICHQCGITELPAEIGRLNRLKILEVSSCHKLKTIAPGAISNLVQLEELVMPESFSQWETRPNGEQRDNAALCELEHLENLTRLEIEITDVNLAAEEIDLDPSSIVRFNINFGHSWRIKNFGERRMVLKLGEGEITFGKWIHSFLTSTEYLEATGDGVSNLCVAQLQSIKKLLYSDSSKINRLVNITTTSMDGSAGIFPLLESLRLYELPNLEEICDASIPMASHSFGNLKTLELENLPALRHIWKGPHQTLSTCNLSSIWLHSCGKLRKLFPLEIARNGLMQLEELVIGKCAMLEEVFWNEENEKDEDRCHITLPRLKNMDLLDLPMLTSFCEGCDLKLSLLEKLRIRECPSLKILTTGSINRLVNITTTSMDRTADIFPLLESLQLHSLPNLEEICDASFGNLKTLELENLPSLPHIWKGPHQTLSLRNLSSIRLHSCGKLRKLFPLEIARNGLMQLEELVIENCEMLEEVFWNEENEKDEDRCHITLPRLKNMVLLNLPMLTSFCEGCDLKLSLLEKLRICECPSLKIFTTGSIMFGCIHQIEMAGCDNFSDIWCHQISPTCPFDQLEKLYLYGCDNIKSLFSSSIAENLVKLEELNIQRCANMVTLIEDDEMSSDKRPTNFPNLRVLTLRHLSSLQSFFPSRRDLKLPLLEQVSIWECSLSVIGGSLMKSQTADCDNISNVWWYQISNGSFNQMKKLEIYRCNGMKKLFPFSITEKLVNLKELMVEECHDMITVIEDDEMSNEKCRTPFPKLQVLKLACLVNLRSIFTCRCDLPLPLLEEVTIRECPLLEFLTTGSSIMFGSLKKIRIDKCRNISNIWCAHISLGYFNHLEKLEIWYCYGIRSLFSHSVSQELVNLKNLVIEGCKEMVEVVEDPDEMLCEKTHLLFPRLQDLVFTSLVQLQSFCRFDVHLPSLESAWIHDCQSLEFFTSGSVSTPKLKNIKIDCADQHVADLNSAIRLFFESNQKKGEIEEKENNEESTLAEAKEVEEDHKIRKIEEENITDEINEELTSCDGTYGGRDQQKGHDEIHQISEGDRVVATLQLFPLNPLYKETNTATSTYDVDEEIEEIDHPTLDLQLKL